MVSVLCCVIPVFSLSPDELRARIDSLERAQAAAARDVDSVGIRIDSLDTTVTSAYRQAGLLETIIGRADRDCAIREQADIASPPLFEITAGDSLLLTDFDGQWFRILHRKGKGYALDECIQHDERIRAFRDAHVRQGGNGAHGGGASADAGR
jgi:hypothetical protein